VLSLEKRFDEQNIRLKISIDSKFKQIKNYSAINKNQIVKHKQNSTKK
jgi:hypothetical protein